VLAFEYAGVSIVTFGADCRLRCIEECGFWDCSSLSSICIPSAVLELAPKGFDMNKPGSVSISEGSQTMKIIQRLSTFSY
jgi:hypothetical protein